MGFPKHSEIQGGNSDQTELYHMSLMEHDTLDQLISGENTSLHRHDDRYLLIEDTSMVGGVFVGDGNKTVYEIPHGLGSTPAYYAVTTASDAAMALYKVTANESVLTVTYALATPAGTGNISFAWMAHV